VLVCTAAADTVGILIYGVVLRSWHLLPHLRLVPARWLNALSDAYPFAVTGIIAIAYRRLDIVLLSAWQGDVAAGQYSASYGLWEAVGLIPASLLDAMFPEMARLAREQMGHRRLGEILHRTGPLLLVGGLLVSALGTALAGTLLPLVYGRAQAHGEAVAAFRLQVWAVPAMFLYLLNGHTLYALGRQRWVTGAMAVVGLVNVALNLLVIPRWSTLGVSAVALFSAWLLWALLSRLAERALRTEEDRR
jgi:O-antigen/teichoic acid export membrane protein